MRNKLLSGTACAALCLLSFNGAARSATLDDVMRRLDKLEKENAELRHKVYGEPKIDASGKPTAKSNPVVHAAVATSPAPPAPPPGRTIGGIPVKAGPLGLEGPWGSIKAGKSDTPYKKSTAAMDPFTRTLGDYNSIMGNTGGDNRAEFDWRMNHAIWYESPIWNGFQLSALISPGQNYSQDNSDYSYGDYFQCNGSSTRGSGSNVPGTGGGIGGS